MDVTITTTAYGRIKSAIAVAKQLQEDAMARILVHEGLPDLIAHRIQHGLDIPQKMAQAHADLQEAEADYELARQTEGNLKGQLQRRAEGKVVS
jgi:hypothetical protein